MRQPTGSWVPFHPMRLSQTPPLTPLYDHMLLYLR